MPFEIYSSKDHYFPLESLREYSLKYSQKMRRSSETYFFQIITKEQAFSKTERAQKSTSP